MPKSRKTLEESLAEARAKAQSAMDNVKKLEAQKRARDAKARKEAYADFGNIVVRALGGDWKSIDPYKLKEYLEADESAKDACLREPVSTDEASAELAEFFGRAKKRAYRTSTAAPETVKGAMLELEDEMRNGF